MATLIPPTFPASGESWHERQLFDRLSQLSDEWTCLHSLRYFARRDGRPGDGEVDFVLLHREYGMVCVEVKGGTAFRIDGNRWSLRNKDGWYDLKKSPFDQVVDNRYDLTKLIRNRTGISVRACWAVCFPTIRVTDDIGTFDRDLIWDTDDINDIPTALERTLELNESDRRPMNREKFQALVDYLAPKLTAAAPLHADASRALADQFELLDEQRRIFDAIKNLKDITVTGPAGSGKTVLATERARQLGSAGREVLFLCYNAPLGKRLERAFHDQSNVTAGSFHGFAMTIADEVGAVPGGERNTHWFDEALPEALAAGIERLGLEFDEIIIDEGQDFRPRWVEVLRSSLSESSLQGVLVMADPAQNLYRDASDTIRLDDNAVALTINCRNTAQINDRACAALGTSIPCRAAESAVDPTAFIVETSDDADIAWRAEVDRLLREGVEPSAIRVLSPSRAWVNRALDSGPPAGVAIDTIHLFKGLEALAVVLVLPPELETPQSLAYVGMTRARAILSVVASNDQLRRLGWPTS